MSTLTTGELIDKVKCDLEDCEYDEKAIAQALTFAINDIVMGCPFPFMRKTETLHLVTGCHAYALPADYDGFYSAKIIDANTRQQTCLKAGAEKCSCGKLPEDKNCGKPCGFSITKDGIEFDKPADRPYIFEFCYYKCAGNLSDIIKQEDTCIPQKYCELVVVAAMIRLHKRNDDYDKARHLQEDFDIQYTKMIQGAIKTDRRQPIMNRCWTKCRHG